MHKPSYKPLRPRTVLAVAAHADDLDFLAGGTLAKLAAEGAAVYYLIATDGSKGSADTAATPRAVIEQRCREQQAAAEACGAEDVFFLGYEDGQLYVTPELKRDIVRYIRRLKPDTVVTLDPSVLYVASAGLINHPDHRACGQATLDAVFPLARDHMSFPELYRDEHLEPHRVQTVLLCNLDHHNYAVDITDTVDTKLRAMRAHASQFTDMAAVTELLRSRAANDGARCGFTAAELFVRLDIPH